MLLHHLAALDLQGDVAQGPQVVGGTGIVPRISRIFRIVFVLISRNSRNSRHDPRQGVAQGVDADGDAATNARVSAGPGGRRGNRSLPQISRIFRVVFVLISRNSRNSRHDPRQGVAQGVDADDDAATNARVSTWPSALRGSSARNSISSGTASSSRRRRQCS